MQLEAFNPTENYILVQVKERAEKVSSIFIPDEVKVVGQIIEAVVVKAGDPTYAGQDVVIDKFAGKDVELETGDVKTMYRLVRIDGQNNEVLGYGRS